MIEVSLKYGKELVNINIPKGNLMDILKVEFPKKETNEKLEIEEIERALNKPIGTSKLSESIESGQKVAIMVSDITRPSPSKKILPPLIEELKKAGIQDKDITIVFGMGIHRSHTIDEQKKLVGEEIYNRIRCIDSNKEEYVYVGKTSRNTPIHLCKSLIDADIRICTGNIEYHYFAGYSGGAKAIMPGAANYESIKNNHRLQLYKNAASGVLDGNPVREDIEEVGEILNINFILNVVLNENKQILKAFAGHYQKAHREGCKYLDSLYSIEIKNKVDIVVVSPGGYPKDINLYQAQKALDNASHAVKDGGIIVLIAECSEGFGEENFTKWLNEASTPNDLITRLRKEFVLGGHKAAAIARIVNNKKVYFISDMDNKNAKKVFFIPKESPQKAIDDAINQGKDEPQILVISQGSSVLPFVNKR